MGRYERKMGGGWEKDHKVSLIPSYGEREVGWVEAS